jgi:uroporphyrinogen-III decarboxylase
MTSRERVIRALRFENPDRVPRDLWYLPGVEMFRKKELEEVLKKYPTDFTTPRYRYGRSKRAKGTVGLVGEYVDAWGCVWRVAEPGVVGEVKEPPLKEWSALKNYQLPWELLDLAYGVREVFILRDMLHNFFLKEMEMWAKTDVNGVSFMDDWGSQNSLLISPKLWREFFKPLYKDYCDILHSHNKFVFFHSDGHIEAIYPDLIEIGIDAINSQLFCMNIEELGRRYKGKITFWGEIDRQYILPFGTVEEVKSAVRRVRKALDTGRGGVIAQCEWGVKDPRENIEAVFEEWEKPLEQIV